MTTLLGATHRVSATDRLSWGVGGAIVRAAPGTLEVRPSGGLFYDRNDSLLASLIVNGTDDLAVRLNVYPGVVRIGRWSPGLYLGVRDDGEVVVGLSLQVVPVGLGGAFE